MFKIRRLKFEETPTRMFLTVIGSVLVAEAIIHVLLLYLAELTDWNNLLVDVFITAGTVSLFVYLFAFRPLVREIRLRREVEESLQKSMDELNRVRLQLEERVHERTRQLEERNASLQEEIATRNVAEEKIRRRNAELAALNTINHQISSSLELNKIFDALQNLLSVDLGIRRGAVFTCEDGDQTVYHLENCWGISDEMVQDAWLWLLQKPEFQQSVRSREPFLIKDHPSSDHWASCAHNDDLCHGSCSIPMLSHDRMMGVLMLFCEDPGGFSDDEIRLFESLTVQLSIAVQNARLFEEVESSRSRLQALSRRLVEVQEKERRYVARELHDEASQALTYLIYALNMLRSDVNSPEAVEAAIDEINRIVQDVLDNLHRLSVNLRPSSLDLLGLIPALRQLAESTQEKHNIDVYFDVRGFSQRLLGDVEISIYRIVQESINNALHHAQASQINILLEQCDDDLRVSVVDDGKGFDPQSLAYSDRLGIFGMRERADMLKGRLSVISAPGNGTEILLEVPDVHSNRRRR